VYDTLPWSKQAPFRLQPWTEWFWPSRAGSEKTQKLEKGGQLKKAGKLSFATIDNAGHSSPGDAPESVAFIVECWVRGTSSHGINCP
jgi:cathepsin A (carboxypeptidase C)